MDGFHSVLFSAMWTAFALPRLKREILSVFHEQMQHRMERLQSNRQSVQGMKQVVAMFDTMPAEGQEEHLDEDAADHLEFRHELMRQISGSFEPREGMDSHPALSPGAFEEDSDDDEAQA